MTNEYVTEPIGLKVIFGGGAFATFGEFVAGIDWASVVGVSVMVFGAALSYAASIRNKAKDKREKEALEATQKREQEKHIAEMAILEYKKKQMEDGE